MFTFESLMHSLSASEAMPTWRFTNFVLYCIEGAQNLGVTKPPQTHVPLEPPDQIPQISIYDPIESSPQSLKILLESCKGHAGVRCLYREIWLKFVYISVFLAPSSTPAMTGVDSSMLNFTPINAACLPSLAGRKNSKSPP